VPGPASDHIDDSAEKPTISELVQTGLDSGLLWILNAPPVWVGDGTLKPCVVCRLRIDGKKSQCDVPGPRGALPAHIACHRIWRAQSDMRREPQA
jgi:hypothetical protein